MTKTKPLVAKAPTTPQEMFDRVVAHFIKQKIRAYIDPKSPYASIGYAGCKYRYEIEQGVTLMCAMGCMIPDEIYNPNMEGKDVRNLISWGENHGVTLPEVITDNPNLATRLQNIHDGSENESLVSLSVEQALRDTAREFDLDPISVDALRKMRLAQEMFDTVVAHFIAQRVRAIGESGVCRFRADELKCAIGSMIPDELYDPEMEGRSTDRLIDWATKHNVTLPEIITANPELGRDLQQVHDHARSNDLIHSQVEGHLRFIADQYFLDPSCLDAMTQARNEREEQEKENAEKTD